MTDQVVRKNEFEQAHPGITFEVERTYFLNHRATWLDPASGERRSLSSISLRHLLDELEAAFGAGDQHPGPKAGGSAITAC